MNYNKTIEDIIFEQEAAELMALGSLYEKQLMMESYYMEEETPSTGEAPKVDGVNALQKFWNWLRRCINIIKTKIAGYFANKKVDKLINQLNQSKPDAMLKLNYLTFNIVYDLTKLNTKELDMLNDYRSKYDPKENYQKLANTIKESSSFKKILDFDVYHDPSLGEEYMREYKVGTLVDMFKKFKTLIQSMAKGVSEANEFIKKQKESLSEDQIKSNNFQQFVRYITESVKLNLLTIRIFGDWCSTFETMAFYQIRNQKDNNINDNNIHITSTSPLKKCGNANDAESALNNMISKSFEECDEFYMTWVNKSDEKYQNWAWNTIVDDKNKEFKDFHYIIAYVPVDVKTNKWRRWTICTPKNSLSDSLLKQYFDGGKLEHDSVSGGRGYSKIIRKKK